MLLLFRDKYQDVFYNYVSSIYFFEHLYGCVGVAVLRGCVILVLLAGILLYVSRYRASACICCIRVTYRITDSDFLHCSQKYIYSFVVLYTWITCVVFICTPFDAICIISALIRAYLRPQFVLHNM